MAIYLEDRGVPTTQQSHKKKEKQETRIVWSATEPEDETVSDTGLPVLEIVREKAGRGSWRPVLIEWKRSVVVWSRGGHGEVRRWRVSSWWSLFPFALRLVCWYVVVVVFMSTDVCWI